jgi:K+-transporting ATPase ATPase C chain
MRKQFVTAILYTVATTLLLGVAYPLAVTALAQWWMPHQANGELITRDGSVIGSKLIGQSFTGAGYFYGRPSAAGSGYDAANSSGSNLGPTNAALIARVEQSVAQFRHNHGDAEVPVDLVTTSASGLDPDISPAAAQYQIPRVARETGLTTAQLAQLVESNTQPRQFGFLGEPRVNVLALNLSLRQLLAETHAASPSRAAGGDGRKAQP